MRSADIMAKGGRCGKRFCLFVVLCAIAARWTAIAQPTDGRPAFKLLRYDEDYRSMAFPQQRTEFLDSVKFIPLGAGSGNYLSLGGEIRERFEFFNNPTWGQQVEGNTGYLLQRYMLHADVHLGESVRFFGQLKSGIESGREGGPRPADEDQLDVNQAFFELASGSRSLPSLRVGRQEISFGSARLVSPREGPNVRQSFDGVRLTWRSSAWQIDALATKPVETDRGVFDDGPNHRRTFWGVYAVRAGGQDKPAMDLYYLGLDRKVARFAQGAGREIRHSLGTRVSGNTGSWDYNYELVYQFGDFADGGIRAWTAASDTGYRLAHVKFRPRIGLRADVASGDGDRSDKTLGTFNALFPKGAYFSEADLLGPYNLMDLHPSFSLDLSRTFTLTPDLDFFWRQSTNDGIYSAPGVLLRSGEQSQARYVGAHAGTQFVWMPDRHWSATWVYLHFFPGRFLRESGSASPVDFVAAWLTYRF